MAGNSEPAGWRSDLLSSRDVWRLYWRLFFKAGGKYDKAIVIVVFILTIALSYAVSFVEGFHSASEMLHRGIKSLSGPVLNIAVGLLGFLIAAFAIFISTINKTLLVQLSKIQKDKLEISEFVFIMVSYMAIFIDYVFLLCVSASALIVSNDDGLIAFISHKVYPIAPGSYFVANAMIFAAMLSLLVQCIFQLKSFIGNLYQSLVLVVATLPEV